ncbi:microbial collagenase [Kitasatospora viridis]|uniref:microbial collagenase n=2 Tax=Kitasatospora viridis TaxID=281105 RepID=A0A561TWD9_9ACTN|nr:microbial collagenase [Kitasatospora viridis]
MRQPSRLPRIMAVLAATSTAITAFATTPSFAAAPAKPTPQIGQAANPDRGPSPTGSIASVSSAVDGGAQNGRTAPTLLPPRAPQTAAPEAAPAPAKSKPAAASRAAGQAATAATSCTPADFSGRTGAALVSFIEGSTEDCISSLYPLRGSVATSVFKESQMTAVANGFQSSAAAYTGDNSTGLFQLIYFLQGGYFVQSNDVADIPAYDASLTNPVQAGLDAIVASPHFTDVTDGNGTVAGQAMILSDSANLQARYINTYKQVLNGYNSSYDSSRAMVGFVNDVFTPIFRGHQQPAYVAAVTADPSLITTLDTFAQNHLSMLGGSESFLDANAALETSRFSEHPALLPVVKPMVQQLLSETQISGPTASVWAPVAGMINYADPNNCSYYNTCNLPTRLKAAALPISYTCDSTHSILAQSLTAADLTAVCTSLENQDGFVHNLVKDNGPIPGQYENTLQMVVFASPQDYQTYAGGIYGIATNNGGMTLVGDPTNPANQPISITYQNGNDGFTAGVWNLNHEFTHALDGRLDMKGNFTQQTAVPDVWWIEGVAEYVSYTYRNVTDTGAVAVAPLHTYALSTLFQNTYENSDTTRTYPWGYLAVRYMVEKHPDVIQNMLSHFRTGDYTGGYAVYNSIGTAYDADFNTWLDACAAGACVVPGTPSPSFYVGANGLNVQFSDTSTEIGSGSIVSEAWNFGDGATATGRYPTHSFAAAGTYNVSITVTDNYGKSETTTEPVTLSTAQMCGSTNTQLLDRNCYRANQSATAGNLDYYYIYLPAGTTTLNVTANGGTGTAYLLYNPNTWATPSAYTTGSTANGTTQSLTVTNTTAGYRYISLYAQTTFSGVTITTQY